MVIHHAMAGKVGVIGGVYFFFFTIAKRSTAMPTIIIKLQSPLLTNKHPRYARREHSMVLAMHYRVHVSCYHDTAR